MGNYVTRGGVPDNPHQTIQPSDVSGKMETMGHGPSSIDHRHEKKYFFISVEKVFRPWTMDHGAYVSWFMYVLWYPPHVMDRPVVPTLLAMSC